MTTGICRSTRFEWIKRSVDYQQFAAGSAAVQTRSTT